MAIRNSRGIENILLRRVRRHQTMSALFRRVHKDSTQPMPVWTPGMVQTKPEDLPITTPTRASAVYAPSTPSKHEPVIQRATSSSPSKPAVPDQQAAGSETFSSPASSLTSDPVWKRLETIFRKHQEQEEGSPASAPGSTVTAPSHTKQERETVQEHSKSKNAIATESSSAVEDHVQTQSTETRVQRVTEEVAKPADSEQPRHKEITHPRAFFTPASNDIANDNTMAIEHSLPDEMIQDTDPTVVQISSTRQQPPLEEIWNVQRLEDHEPHSDENTTTPFLRAADPEQTKPSFRAPSSPEPQSEWETKPLGESKDHLPSAQAGSDVSPRSSEAERVSLAPIETLSPSKPRPASIASVPSKRNIQRQPILEDSSAKEISEQPPVDTAIGPLPADLWWLLGEKPPSAEAPVETPNVRPTSVSRKEIPPDQGSIFHAETSSEKLVTGTPTSNTIQRQALLNQPPISNRQESVHTLHMDKPKHFETDLDELARRVYAEVRRRLAAEWERSR